MGVLLSGIYGFMWIMDSYSIFFLSISSYLRDVLRIDEIRSVKILELLRRKELINIGILLLAINEIILGM